jgi:hypothetical protein
LAPDVSGAAYQAAKAGRKNDFTVEV